MTDSLGNDVTAALNAVTFAATNGTTGADGTFGTTLTWSCADPTVKASDYSIQVDALDDTIDNPWGY